VEPQRRRGLVHAENASLAILEVLVHLDKSVIPLDFVLLETTVPDQNILTVASVKSGSEFLQRAYEDGYRALGKNDVGFSIPSVIVPNERIVVLYPDAPLSAQVVAMTRVTPFSFDRRLFSPSTAVQ
jgi:RES domain-containing protein